MFDSKLGLGLRKRIEMKFLSLEKLGSHLVKSKVKINELVCYTHEKFITPRHWVPAVFSEGLLSRGFCTLSTQPPPTQQAKSSFRNKALT